ncbi:MAG: DNA repair protein RecN [Oscillospiraceae bacterium]|jgi:DNA repair protein RecN (Recombination protein N)|nr:DNA repair protein RecN [Oscillospiraceae bacterium]
MLSLLHIENIAVIELSDIVFDPKLNVLTGETGAGKSIVIDSLSALLGQRASRDLIRSGHDSAEVSGVFIPPDGGEVLLQRELREDGRNICRVGGKPLTLAALREIGDGLVNIHGQHDSQALLREETHLGYLDAFCGTDLERYGEAYSVWRSLRAERDSLSVAEDEKAAKVAVLTYRLQEVRDIKPKMGEEDALLVRKKTLRSAAAIREALSGAYYALYGDEDSNGACGLCESAVHDLNIAVSLAPELEGVAERLREVQYTLRDCSEETLSFYEGMEDSEEELERVETRLDKLSRLRGKLKMNLDGIIAAVPTWEAELESLEMSDQRLAKLEEELRVAEAALDAEAAELTASRREGAEKLAKRMEEEFSDLDMAKVKLTVDFEERDPSPSGKDGVRFSVATNPGEPFKPLSKIASGGEMARIMLALKNLLAEGDAVQTMVFDEVDSGVSGRAAQRVAEKLSAVSRKKQVLCVTHLPQIAAFADTHFRVEKDFSGGRTVTRVQKLDRAARVEELARLMAGFPVTESARRTAEELLTQGDVYKKTLAIPR